MDHTFESYNTVVVDENGENPEEVNFDGNTLPGIHPHTFVCGLDIVTKPGFYFNGTYSFFDDIFLNNENSSEDDSYQLLNFKIGFAKRISDNIGFDIYAGMNNALDDNYSEVHTLNSAFGGFFDPAMDRNYYARMRLNYTF